MGDLADEIRTGYESGDWEVVFPQVGIVGNINDPYYTTGQLAKALRKNPTTILRWCQQGYLPALLLGGRYRIYAVALEVWLEARRNVRG